MHVVATAGHVDHGKSTLVRALTGIEPDRLAEERERGLTIDLGYAWMTLDDGRELAFVDVPGHQRFISNMLAGVGPVPAVLFAVASDEGWSAQSSEHLAALDALQVRHGVLALTRADLGDAALAEEEARQYLAGTSLEGVEAVAVSAVTGAGLGGLRDALARMTAGVPEHVGDRTRLWVDRVFSVRGAGTVVTGTLASGAIAVDSDLQLHGRREPVRIRGIQTLKAGVERVDAVARVALNLRGVKTGDVVRGDALTAPGAWPEVTLMDVRLAGTGGAALPASLVLHIGSAAIPAFVRMLGADAARLTLARSIPTAIGERVLLRDPGTRRIAAAVVLDPMPPALSRRGAARRRTDELAGLTAAPDVAGEVRRRVAVRRRDLVLIGAMAPADRIPAGVVSAGEWLIDADEWARWRAALPPLLDAWAADHPLRPGMARQALMEALDAPGPELIDALAGESDLIVVDGAGVHRRGHEPTLAPEAAAALEQLVRRLEADPFDAPAAPELVEAGLSDRVLNLAVRQGRLIRVGGGVYLRPTALQEAARRLRELDQPFTMAAARESLGTSRRVALPLLERLDQTRVTRRLDAQLREVVA